LILSIFEGRNKDLYVNSIISNTSHVPSGIGNYKGEDSAFAIAKARDAERAAASKAKIEKKKAEIKEKEKKAAKGK
jgi:hypothetical protein